MNQWPCRIEWFGEPGMHPSPRPSPLRGGEGESLAVGELLEAFSAARFMGSLGDPEIADWDDEPVGLFSLSSSISLFPFSRTRRRTRTIYRFAKRGREVDCHEEIRQ